MTDKVNKLFTLDKSTVRAIERLSYELELYQYQVIQQGIELLEQSRRGRHDRD
jgi:hypothetical protein